MSSCRKKKLLYGGGESSTKDGMNEPPTSDRPGGEEDNGSIPLESRMIEIRSDNGSMKQVPALDKRWVPSMHYIEFYLPSCKTLLEEETALLTWLDYMEMYSKDLKWLLSAPHHQFWSVIVHSPEVSQVVLQSFLLRAPHWFDKEFSTYLEHDIIGPKYSEIYTLVFRVFMRLCTYKESKRDFITPITWTSLLTDHQILDILKLQTLCCLYDSECNTILPKMIENVMKNCPKFLGCFRNLIPILLSKSEEMTIELMRHVQASSSSDKWVLDDYEDILAFFLSTTCGLYKFCKLYVPAAEILLKFPNVLLKLASTYEPQCCKLWSKVSYHLPTLEQRIMVLRMLIIRLYRFTLVSATVHQVSSSNDQRIDEFFEVLTNCLDEKTFIRDYEKAYPFKQDINDLLSRGVFIDETRIDYMANAISACFHACGEDYAVEKIVVDPLYDPNFDRQLLGACSLDITGVELQSLVTQVKDILPELPDSYVEVVLKHYGYQSEVAINALLEGSVPTRLEKYKNESYVGPLNEDRVGPSDRGVTTDNDLEQLASKLQIGDLWKRYDAEAETERFYAGKRRHGFEDFKEAESTDKMEDDMKVKIKDICSMRDEPTKDVKSKSSKKSVKIQADSTDNYLKGESYIDESLLPTFHQSVEYEDEYDDTYDELGVGMTEPDNIEYKPLNQKLSRAVAADDDEEEDGQGTKKMDQLYEDPAIVRARLERRRDDKMHHQRRGPPPSQADVVGKAKGQGQEKDVLYARRQKTANKDSGGFKKKRADFKRREF